MKKILTLSTAILIACSLSAQKSSSPDSYNLGEKSEKKAVIKGKVKDQVTGETIIGANVFIPSSTTGTTSDFDGNFSLECPPGEITLKISFVSYDTKEYDLYLKPGEEKEINVIMNEIATELAQVEVKAKANRENENLLLMEQQKAGKIKECIGAQELSKKGISDVADGVKKITGISMMGSRNIFVRGLGDRYNKTELNGLGMASPNPEERLLPLDMFPVSIISTIDVQKIYAVSDYADYSGALIDIQTKDYPEEGFLKIKAGTKINNQTTFNSFKLSETSETSNFGLNTNENINYTPTELNQINDINTDYYFSSDPFLTDFDYQNTLATPDTDLGISGGKSWCFDNNHTLGAVFSSGYSNGYEFIQGNDVVLKSDGTVLKSFNFDQYDHTASFSNLGALSWEHNDNKISYNLLYLHNTENSLTDKSGFDGEGYDLFVRTMMYHKHSLLSNQLKGRHKPAKNLELSWDASYSKGKSSEPDRRGVVYERSQSTYGDDNIPYDYYSLFTLNQGETLRYFSDMVDSTVTGGVHAKYIMEKNEQNKRHKDIQFGVQGMSKNRDFNSYMYFYNVDKIADQTAGVSNPENGIYHPDPYDIDVTNNINDAAFADSNIYIKNNTQNRDIYRAYLNILATYAELNYNITPYLFLNIGLRGEYSDQTIAYYDTRPRENSIYGLDIFPAMNLRYTLSEKSNLRFALSKTMTRANFIEMAPFRYRPSYGSATTFGNENIQNADNYNLDFKYELFPASGEIISVGVYGKILKSPIERISLNQGGGMEYTYRNANSGKVLGCEMEIKKKIVDKLSAGINASYIYTHIDLPENSSNTFKSHAMQGASPYLINADVMYNVLDLQGIKTDVSILYNVYGKRIFAIGDGGKGDIHELPFNSLDAMVKTKINNRWEFNLSARNLLNAERVYVQDIVNNNDGNYISTGEKEINRYKTGMWFGMGISYTLK
ncbi:MAG: TonB-dependent receptor domain-containing protein [Bacteroidales bacterium]